MSIEELQVDPESVARCARRLGDSGRRVAAGLAESPPLLVAAPGWAAAAALADLERAAGECFGRVGAQVAAVAAGLGTAAAEYRAADERAADRVAGAR